MNSHDFAQMMEEVDAELRRENVRIDRRPASGFSRACDRLGVGLTFAPLKEPAIPGKYEGDSLSAHILGWFEERYGDRLNMDFSVGHVAALIRNDPWRLYIPRVLGTVDFVCDRRLALYRDRPSFSSDGRTPVFKILSAIEDLPDGLASALTQDELDVITSFFLSSGEAVTVLEEVLDRPFIREARDDLRSAVDHLLTKPAANCGFSRWSSLQFIEKLLKGYLGSRGTSYGFTHDLTELAELAEQRGLIVDRVALRALQCAAALRYDSQAISMADAMAAHHHSLGLGRQIGHAILGRPGCVQWQVSGISGV